MSILILALRRLFLPLQNSLLTTVMMFESCSDVRVLCTSGHLHIRSTLARTIATQSRGNGNMNDLKIERSFDSQTTWVIAVLSLYYYIYP